MTSVAVLFPWAGEDPHRTAAFTFVRAWYAEHHPDWRLCTGEAPAGDKWCKAEAVRNAARQSNAEIFVVADADCIAPQVGEAVNAVRSGYGWAMPHFIVHRLTEMATHLFTTGAADPETFPRTASYYTQMPYAGYPGGGIVVLPRQTYASAPLDPRFTGWGQEDECWAMALRTLHGPQWRPPNAPLWHLWHPPQNRMSRAVGSSASRDLHTLYRRSATKPLMEANLAQARVYAAEGLVVSGGM